MKSFRIIALSFLVTVTAFCAVFYSSCKKDGCKGVTCLNGGTCSAGMCSCPTGYTGVTCQTLAALGTWKGNDTCNPTGTNIITITASSELNDTTHVLISNPGNFGANVQVTGTVSPGGTVIKYTNQPIMGKETVSGTITVNSATSINNTYSIMDSSVTLKGGCGGAYTLQ